MTAIIPRSLKSQIKSRLSKPEKAVVLYGARQVGKTTLVEEILKELPDKILSINADEERFIDILSSRDSRKLGQLVSGYDLLFIDEAQRIPDIGINLKILVDKNKDLKIIATGSSSFELAEKVSEPLTGRKWSYELYPISMGELAAVHTPHELDEQLEERLIWGSYPEIFFLTSVEEKTKYLRELSTDYLYKDLLRIAELRNANKLRTLLKLLAFQVGSEVSLNELSRKLEISKDTVERYINLLEKAFVIFELKGFQKNLRKEVTQKSKYYFYDLGFRNVLIDNLRPLSDRNDHGSLWENFLIAERRKSNSYAERNAHQYFWRTYTGAEVDYVEELGGKLYGFEFKYGDKAAKVPKSWKETYPGASWAVVNARSWRGFLLAPSSYSEDR